MNENQEKIDKKLNITLQRQDFETIYKKKANGDTKKYRGYKSQIEHNNRTEQMDENYLVRPENTKKNFYWINKNYDTEEKVRELIDKTFDDYKKYHKRKMPKNTKPLMQGYISFSETMQQDFVKFGKSKMITAVYNFLRSEYGDNLLTFDLHLDETTPHFHFSLLNYDFKQHRTHSKLLEEALNDKANPMRKNEQQDRLEAHLKTHINDFDYRRGDIRSIKDYHTKRKAHQRHIERQLVKLKELNKSHAKKNKEQDEIIKKKEAEIKKLDEEFKSATEQYKKQLDGLENMKNTLLSELDEIFSELGEVIMSEQQIQKVNAIQRIFKKHSTNDNLKKMAQQVEKAKKVTNAIKKASKKTSSSNNIKQP